MDTLEATIPETVEIMPNTTALAPRLLKMDLARQSSWAPPTPSAAVNVETGVLKMSEVPSHRLHFRGSGRELFSIYLINLFQTVLTLGLYSFWAKTKIRRYLWGASEFDGDRFVYHGTGNELFVGWLKAIIAFGLLGGIPALLTWTWKGSVAQLVASTIYYAGLGLLLPIARMGSLRYRLSRTSWRDIRFSFRARLLPLIRLSLRGYFYTLFTFGLYLPYYQNEMRRFLTKHAFFGSRRFKFDGRGKALFKPYLAALGWTLAATVLGIPITASIMALVIGKAFASLAVLLLFAGAVGIIWAWYGATQRRYYWDHTSFGSTTFKSSVTPQSLLTLYETNLVILVLTLGLALPWVRVRTMNYDFEHLVLNGTLNLEGIVQETQLASPSGDALAGLFGVGDLAA